MDQTETFDSFAIVELMGHVRMAGRLTEEERFGGKMGRLDVPDGEAFTTVYFTAASVYRLTPCSEEAARAVAAHSSVRPVHVYELPKPELPRPTGRLVNPDELDDEIDYGDPDDEQEDLFP